MHDLNFIEKIQNKLYLRRGFSFNLEYGFHPPKEGYMVGNSKKELIFNSIESLSQGKEEILALLEKYGNSTKNVYLGGWINSDKKVHIEPSAIIFYLPTALSLGHVRNQRAIYDLKNEKNILINKEG